MDFGDLSVFKQEDKMNELACNKSYSQCQSITRLFTALKYYTILNIDKNQNDAYIFEQFINDVYHTFIDDYLHFIHHHYHKLENIDFLFESMFKRCNNVHECQFAIRHINNDKVSENINPTTRYRVIMDSLHFYLFHCFDGGLKIKSKEKFNTEQKEGWTADKNDKNDLKWKSINNNLNTNNESITNQHNIYDYTFMTQYSNISYISNSKLVINGCIRALSLLCRNKDYNDKISELTYKYYFETEKHIFQFGYDVWKMLDKINKIEFINDIKYKAFIGNDLIIEIKQKYKHKYRFSNIISYCCDLLKCKYIQLIGIKQGAKKPNNKFAYMNDTQYLYEFSKLKKREFEKYHYFHVNMLDRKSWNIGTQVEIFSSTLNGWVLGEIIQITNDNNILVSYDGGYDSKCKYLLKTVNKNNINLIRSTRNYILSRNKWKVGKAIEIFSHSDMKWCIGIIESVIPKDINNNIIDTLRIKYKKFSDGIYYTKKLNFWSCDLRDIEIIGDKKLLKYKYNKKCEIYLNDKNIWIINNIKHILPMHKYVIVENPKTKIEKIVDVNSKLIRLLNE